MDEIELAWAAGFWDGEGCVSLSYRGKYKYPRSVLQVAQVQKEPLERFQKAVGFGNILGPYPPKGTREQEYYIWRVEGSTHLSTFKALLYKYLCSPKQEQIDRAVAARKIFEETATCPIHVDIKLVLGGAGYRCVPCQSEQAIKRNHARWHGKE